MKFLKILLCSLLIVTIVSVPCFATNVNNGMYGHYISSGTYLFDDTLSGIDITSVNVVLNFDFSSNNQIYDAFAVYSGNLIVQYAGGDSVTVYTDGGWVDDTYRTIDVIEGFYIYDPVFFSWWQSNSTRIDAGYDSNLMDSFLSTFTFVGQWISGAAEDLTAMFWFDGSLTFVGTLAVASLAMAVSFLIIGLISRFLRFRG